MISFTEIPESIMRQREAILKNCDALVEKLTDAKAEISLAETEILTVRSQADQFTKDGFVDERDSQLRKIPGLQKMINEKTSALTGFRVQITEIKMEWTKLKADLGNLIKVREKEFAQADDNLRSSRETLSHCRDTILAKINGLEKI